MKKHLLKLILVTAICTIMISGCNNDNNVKNTSPSQSATQSATKSTEKAATKTEKTKATETSTADKSSTGSNEALKSVSLSKAEKIKWRDIIENRGVMPYYNETAPGNVDNLMEYALRALDWVKVPVNFSSGPDGYIITKAELEEAIFYLSGKKVNTANYSKKVSEINGEVENDFVFVDKKGNYVIVQGSGQPPLLCKIVDAKKSDDDKTYEFIVELYNDESNYGDNPNQEIALHSADGKGLTYKDAQEKLLDSEYKFKEKPKDVVIIKFVNNANKKANTYINGKEELVDFYTIVAYEKYQK